MTTAEAQPLAIPSFDTKVKMEERKRSLAPDADADAPPRKRLLKDENGQAMRMDAEKEKDVEAFQKDALMRQMKEYKREKKHYQDLVDSLTQQMTHHDDHLRIVDAWFSQLLDEIRILAANTLPTPPPSAGSDHYDGAFNSALEFRDSATFSKHLTDRSAKIKGAISDIFGRIPAASPEMRDLQEQLASALAKEKDTVTQCQRLASEKEQLTERLESASYRYMKAEKALERAKSLQVQKLERQAVMGGNGEASSPTVGKKAGTPVKREPMEANGELENGATSDEADIARKEALASAEKRKQQLEEIEAENERLTNELSAARTKTASLTDDDYADTSLFKTIKSQHEDVVNKVNDLTATNVQLREEAQKLQAERTTYRAQIYDESRTVQTETETMLARTEADLARVRNGRDELAAEVAVLRSAAEKGSLSSNQAKELAEARDSRIAALESETERLKLQLGESAPMTEVDLDVLDAEVLKSRLRTLETQYVLLSNELPSMEAAWKKTQALASRKVAEIGAQEEQVAQLKAEKAKADQKYFAAMKAKDAREGDLRMLRNQSSQSSAIITGLKDTDRQSRELIVALERQLAESNEVSTKLEQMQRASEQKLKESGVATEGLKKQIEELKALVSGKDKEFLAAGKAKREADDALEQCKVRLEETKQQYDTLKKTRVANSSADSDDWRKVAICPVCNANIRNTVLKLCGHVFCHACVKDLISNRSRKCPSCGRGFGSNDQMGIVLT